MANPIREQDAPITVAGASSSMGKETLQIRGPRVLTFWATLVSERPTAIENDGFRAMQLPIKLWIIGLPPSLWFNVRGNCSRNRKILDDLTIFYRAIQSVTTSATVKTYLKN